MINSSIFEIKKAQRDSAFKVDHYDSAFQKIKELRHLNNDSNRMSKSNAANAKINKESISLLCGQIYEDFKKSKENYETNQLSQSKYFSLLNVLRLVIDNLSKVDGQKINEWEILSEVYKHGLI